METEKSKSDHIVYLDIKIQESSMRVDIQDMEDAMVDVVLRV